MPNNFINQYPYSDFHEMNLDWILKAVRGVSDDMKSFIASNKVVYKGLWDITQQYENNDIVLDQVRGYMMISIQPVPAGIDITNTDYWIPVSPFKVDVEFDNTSYNAIANKTVTEKFETVDNSIEELNSLLQTETTQREAADSELDAKITTNSERIDTEEITREATDTELNNRININTSNLATEANIRASADSVLASRIDEIASLPEGSTSGDAELIDIRIAANGETYPSAGDAVRAQFDLLDDMINGDTISNKYTPILTSDHYINSEGSIVEEANYSVTNYIDIEGIISFKTEDMTVSPYYYYCLYDVNYTPIIPRQSFTNGTDVSINVERAKYMLVSTATLNFEAGDLYLTEYTRVNAIEIEVDQLKKANVITSLSSENLIEDSFLRPGNNTVLVSPGWSCTDFIELPFDESGIRITGTFSGIAGCAIYNSKKQVILGIDGSNVETYGGHTGALDIQTIEVPYQEGQMYIRISAYEPQGPDDIRVRGYEFNHVYQRLLDLDRKVDSNLSDSIAASKVLVIGDSISTDEYGSYKKWVTDLIEDGFLPLDNTTNSSQHATGFVATNDGAYPSFITRLETIENKSSYDLVIVFGGINDYIQSIPMGQSGQDKTQYFVPAVDYFFEYLIKNFTQARICVLTPLRTSNIYKNLANEYQQSYSDYIKTVADYYCFPVLDLTTKSGFCPFIEEFNNLWTLQPSGYLTHDGVHPTELYESKFLAPMIKNFLKGMM